MPEFTDDELTARDAVMRRQGAALVAVRIAKFADDRSSPRECCDYELRLASDLAAQMAELGMSAVTALAAFEALGQRVPGG